MLMSDNGEDFTDFQNYSKTQPAESMVGAYCAESTDRWTASSGITVKIPPLFDGSTSWFKYEELIDDWLDLTQLEVGKRGQALKNRLVGDASMYKGFLDRESLRPEEGVKYFTYTLRHQFIKGALSVFTQGFFQFIRARRENIVMVKWIGKFSLLSKRLLNAWMHMLPMSSMSEARRQSLYQADVERENGDRRIRNHELLDPEARETREGWNATQVTAHEALFPFSDNLTTLMFIDASDLSEAQRERLTSSLSLQAVEVTAYTFEAVKKVFVELFCTPKISMENLSLRVNKYGSHTTRTFIVKYFIEDEFGQEQRWILRNRKSIPR